MSRPALTVLQLDTSFPRVPGDVACAQTYTGEVEILRIPAASVGRIVTRDPAGIDIMPFEEALRAAKGDVIATSCGFLSYWQGHLEGLTDRPVVTSALCALPRLARTHTPEEVMILTFDAGALGLAHLRGHEAFASSVVGLAPDGELRRVIEGDLPQLDTDLARAQVLGTVHAHRTERHRTVLLECTNLPPYAGALRAEGLEVVSILSEIERVRPGTVAVDWL